MKYMRIAEEIFDLFPHYNRGVVLAWGVQNRETSPELARLLFEEAQRIRDAFAGQDLNGIENLASWRDAFRQIGLKPTKHRPSIDALVRRIMQGAELPLINTLADIGNLFSLRYLAPVGGHDIDVLIDGMDLRPAIGNETFSPFGTEEIENPDPGEIIFTDGNRVMTRRWVWRQARHSILQTTTQAMEYNIDGLPPANEDLVRQIGDEISAMVRETCGGETTFQLLNASNPELLLDQGA